MIEESHQLQELFQALVGRHYAEEIGIRDPQVVAYVSHLLAEFCEGDQLFKFAARPIARSPKLARCCSSLIRSTVPRRRLTASARCANISAITRSSSRECFRRASITSACVGIAWIFLLIA